MRNIKAICNKTLCFLLWLLNVNICLSQGSRMDCVVIYRNFSIRSGDHNLGMSQSRCPELIISGILYNSGLKPKNAISLFTVQPTQNSRQQEMGSLINSLKPALLEQHYRFLFDGFIYNNNGYTEFRTTLTDVTSGKEYYFDTDESDMNRIYLAIENLSRRLLLKVTEIISGNKTRKLGFACFTSTSTNIFEAQLDNTFPVQYISTQFAISVTPSLSALPFANSMRFCKLDVGLPEISDSLGCDLLYTGYKTMDTKGNVVLRPFVYGKNTKDTFFLPVISGRVSVIPYKQEAMAKQLRTFLLAAEELFSNDSLYKKISGVNGQVLLKELDTLMIKKKYFLGSYLVSKLPAKYSDTAVYLKAKITYLQNAFTEAVDYYNVYLALPGKSENPEALSGLYKCYLELNFFSEALLVARRLTHRYPRNEIFQFWLGKCLYLSDSSRLAVDAINKSMLSGNRSAETYYFLGRAYLRLGDFTNSESNLKKAIQLDSVETTYPMLLSSLYAQKTDTILTKEFVMRDQSLIPYLDAISKYDPDNYRIAGVIHKRIVIRDYKRAYEMVIAHYQKDTINNKEIFFDAAVWSRRILSDGKYDSLSLVYAAEYLKHYLRVSKSSFSTLKLLGSTYYRLGQYKAAIRYYMEARSYNRNDAINLLNIAEAAVLSGDSKLAINTLDTAITLLPKDENLMTKVTRDGIESLIYFYIIAAKTQLNENVSTEIKKMGSLLSSLEVKKDLNRRWSFQAFRVKVNGWQQDDAKTIILTQLNSIDERIYDK